MAMKNRNVMRRLLCAWLTVPTFAWALSGRTTDLSDRNCVTMVSKQGTGNERELLTRKNAFAKKKYRNIRA